MHRYVGHTIIGSPIAGVLLLLLVVSVLAAPAAVPGVSETEVVLGMWAPFTGQLSPSGVASRDGLRVWADEVNARGGIHGRRVRLVLYDDAGSPPEAVAAVRRLLSQDRGFALVCGSGGGRDIAAMDIIRESEAPFVSCITADKNLMVPFAPTVFRIYANEIYQSYELADYMAGRKGHKRVAILHNSLAFGVNGRDLMNARLKERFNLEFVAAEAYNVGEQDFRSHLLRISQARPDALVIHAFAADAGIIVRQVRELGMLMPLYGGGAVPTPLLPQAAGSVAVGIIAPWVFPVFPESDAPPVRAYKQKLQALYPSGFPVGRPSLYDMTGYMAGTIVEEGLRRAGRNLTRAGFIRALETLQSFVPGGGLGFPVTFTRTDHEGSKQVVMARLNGRLQWELLRE
ncbi:MAG TPA: ABC transporter substrate-binding protein [bacterium]|nr:ABC transporter substrate-binding protein [bacterium]